MPYDKRILVQHQDLHRKLLMRKRLLRWALDGPAYVPFCGDGDIAVELYGGRDVYGADIDKKRVDTARLRLPHSDLRVADCDQWPLADVSVPFTLADFDTYAYPYHAFRAFWTEANKAQRLVMFFTDGEGQAMFRRGEWINPAGEHVGQYGNTMLHRKTYYQYFNQTIMPWFEAYVAPWRILDRFRYTVRNLLYWGTVIENGKANVQQRKAR
jgi:hypothetical protein